MSEINKIVPTTITVMMITATPSKRPMWVISFSSGVGSSLTALSKPAIAPISVAMPVAVTIARPVPCATAVPLNTMFNLSPKAAVCASGAVFLSTASLSPVNGASSTRSDAAVIKRASAPTASPSASTSTSPTTSSALLICKRLPPRKTDERASVMLARAATASLALASSTYPNAPFSSTTAPITSASIGQPAKPSTPQATRAIAMAASKR